MKRERRDSTMKSTKIALLATVLIGGLGLMFALAVAPVEAKPKKCGTTTEAPGCGGGGGGESENLQATFDLIIVTMLPNISAVPSNIGFSFYQHSKKDHVGIGTGSGDGFRFDTNTQNVNKMSRWMSGRLVSIGVAPFVVDGDPRDYEIDFRFNHETGLDLGSLAGGDSGAVAAAFKYFGGVPVDGFDVSNHGVLAFGELTTSPPRTDTCLIDTDPIEVKRNSDGTWTLKSTGDHLACAFAIDANGDIECTYSIPCSEPVPIRFEFEFTLTQQP